MNVFSEPGSQRFEYRHGVSQQLVRELECDLMNGRQVLTESSTGDRTDAFVTTLGDSVRRPVDIVVFGKLVRRKA